MRFLIIAVSISALALATGAFAQATPQSPPRPKPLRNLPRRLRRARVWTLCSGNTRAGFEAKTECLTGHARAVLYLQTGAMFVLVVPQRAESISNSGRQARRLGLMWNSAPASHRACRASLGGCRCGIVRQRAPFGR